MDKAISGGVPRRSQALPSRQQPLLLLSSPGEARPSQPQAPHGDLPGRKQSQRRPRCYCCCASAAAAALTRTNSWRAHAWTFSSLPQRGCGMFRARAAPPLSAFLKKKKSKKRGFAPVLERALLVWFVFCIRGLILELGAISAACLLEIRELCLRNDNDEWGSPDELTFPFSKSSPQLYDHT